MPEDNIIVFAQYAQLQKETDALRETLAELFLEHDELIFHTCPGLQTAYMMRFGALEYKLYELQCNVLRIKRKIDLIQTKINRDEPVSLQSIERQLDIEYAECAKTLEEKMAQMNDALHRHSTWELLSPEDSAELTKLYHKIVRRLHPDLNKNITEQEELLFFNAVSAYENGDLAALHTIALLVEETGVKAETISGLKELHNKKESLVKHISGIEEEIERIKLSFPYDRKELLEDKEQTAAWTDELNALITEYKEIYTAYETKAARDPEVKIWPI